MTHVAQCDGNFARGLEEPWRCVMWKVITSCYRKIVTILQEDVPSATSERAEHSSGSSGAPSSEKSASADKSGKMYGGKLFTEEEWKDSRIVERLEVIKELLERGEFKFAKDLETKVDNNHAAVMTLLEEIKSKLPT